jgi:hypothetical protein
MATIATPSASEKRTDKSQSPSLKADGISRQKNHLPREAAVEELYNTAKLRQHVVLGSSAATGKTSLLQLLEKKLEREEGTTVLKINLNRGFTATYFLERLAKEAGIEQSTLKKVKNTWILFDDAQNAYDKEYDALWHFVVKEIGGVDETEGNLFVVIAATYDLRTAPLSPADFHSLIHITPNVTRAETEALFNMHAKSWGYTNWNRFCDQLIQISKFSDSASYHIGVVMAGVRLMEDMRKRKRPGQEEFTEERALAALRQENYTHFLDRCFSLPEVLPDGYNDQLLDKLINEGKYDTTGSEHPTLSPFLRAGVLTRHGTFACLAAHWYYNRRCFPNRAKEAPESLDQLVILAVKKLSAKRLKDTLLNGFPKEATFQHLFNEAMSQLLPLQNVIIPELNTVVENSPQKIQTGELDFYINGNLKWCLELLRCGDKIGPHLARFDTNNGKYRKVDMSDYIVVDCRGPKIGNGVQPSASRCTLYFDLNFQRCLCQVRNEAPITIELAN